MRLATIALAALALTAGAACSPSGSSGGGPEVKVTLSDFKYTPDTIEIPANAVVKITGKNAGSVEHDLTIEAVGYKLLVPTAREVSKSVGPLQAGTYDMHCTVPGHLEAGMKGTVVVK